MIRNSVDTEQVKPSPSPTSSFYGHLLNYTDDFKPGAMPMNYFAIRKDRGGKNERWNVYLATDQLTLIDPSGTVVAQYTPHIAESSITFPSFSQSIKYTTIATDEGIFSFEFDKAALAALKHFANRGIIEAGPERIKSILTTAILTTIAGTVISIFGLIMLYSFISDLSASRPVAGRMPIVATILGLAALCRGIYGFFRYAHLKKIAATEIPTLS